MKKRYKIPLFIIVLLFLNHFLQGCFLIRKMTGADIDAAQFDKAREAKMYEVRMISANNLAKRIAQNDPLDNADITFYLSEELLQKIVKQYESSSGWLDASTSYIIKSINLNLLNGSAIASLNLLAHNDSYGVDLDLIMDCIVALEMNQSDLMLKLEPFNISPKVSTSRILSSTEELIQDIIKVNLAEISKKIPQLKIPVNISNKMQIQDTKINIRDKINLSLYNPSRQLNYKLKLKEVLIFEGKAFVALNFESVEVK